MSLYMYNTLEAAGAMSISQHIDKASPMPCFMFATEGKTTL